MPDGNPTGGEIMYTLYGEDGWGRLSTNEAADLNFTPSHRPVEREYGRYSHIRACNEFISRAPEADIDEDLKSRYIAEARFIRAFWYARLNFLFGDIPLITEPTPADFFPKKATRSKVFDFVINELTEISNP